MKIRCAIAAVVASLVSVASATQAATGFTQTVESTPGLLAYYQFSNSTNSSVNAYTGTLSSGATLDAAGSGPALADDPTNSALNLAGTSGNELHSSLSSGVTTSGSITAWINLAELPSTPNRFFYVAGQSAGGDDFDLQFQNDNKLYFYTDSGGNVASAAFTASDLNKWVFVAATFTASNDRNLYINGSLVASNTPGGHHDSGNAFTIGYSDVFGGRAFHGDIDEVAFYNTDLSAAQVAAIYDSASVPEPASLTFAVIAAIPVLRRRR